MVVGIVAAVSFTIVMLGVVVWASMKHAKSQQQTLQARVEGEEIVHSTPHCNYFGQASRGVWQVRGNGTMVLTRTALHYQMLMPDKSLSIPIDRIVEVRTPKSFLGKRTSGRLLEVVFQDDRGGNDSAAWWVPDLDGWLDALSRVRASSSTS